MHLKTRSYKYFGRNILKLSLLCFLLIFCLQCKKEDPYELQIGWTSRDISTIPFRVRYQKWKRGNLIRNPSFEEGRTFNLDSITQTFNLDGWKKIGDHVQWVNILADSIYEPSEACSGNHAIKIIKEKSDELSEQNVGILSEYIKVIPGNYALKLDIKLENVQSHKERIGARLYDAINISLVYYDKNKIKLPSGIYCPNLDNYIDNSNKNYSLVNFTQIDKLDWTTLIGRTYNYPFSDGDIADEAKYVRILISFNGTGTVWIDNVNLSYTKWNLTTAERLQHYFDSTLTIPELLVPKPKIVQSKDTIIMYNPDSGYTDLPVILAPFQYKEETAIAIQMLKEALEKNIRTNLGVEMNIPVIKSVRNNNNTRQLIFSIGDTYLYARYSDQIRDDKIAAHEQGYIIKHFQDSINVVFLKGNKPIGDYYAAATARQLFGKSSCIYFDATVLDYPDYLDRSIVIQNNKLHPSNLSSFLSQSAEYKISRFIADIKPNDEVTHTNARIFLESINDYPTLEPGIITDLYHCRDNSDINDCSMISSFSEQPHIGNKQVNEIMNFLAGFMQEKNLLCILESENSLPYNVFQKKNQNLNQSQFFGDFRTFYLNQFQTLNRITNWIDNKNPSVKIIFTPTFSHNEAIDLWRIYPDIYFHELNALVKSDLWFGWSGISDQSQRISYIDAFRYKEYIGEYPVLIDNTYYSRSPLVQTEYFEYYPSKIRMSNIFEPYSTELPDTLYKLVPDRIIVLKGGHTSTIDKIRYFSFCDYAWNNRYYDPDFSLLKILIMNYGKEGARDLILFNDAYIRLLEICYLMESEGLNQKYIKKAESSIIGVNVHYKNLITILPASDPFIQQLKVFKEGIIKRYNTIYEERLVNEKLEQDSSFSILSIGN